MWAPSSSSSRDSTSPRDIRWLPSTVMRATFNALVVKNERHRLVDAEHGHHDGDGDLRDERRTRQTEERVCAAGDTWARRNRLSLGAATGSHRRASSPVARAAPRARRSARSRLGTARDGPGAERQHGVTRAAPSPPDPPPASIDLFHDAHRPSARARDRLGHRFDRHAGNRFLAGRVDVGQHDLVGVRRTRGRTPASARSVRV